MRQTLFLSSRINNGRMIMRSDAANSTRTNDDEFKKERSIENDMKGVALNSN